MKPGGGRYYTNERITELKNYSKQPTYNTNVEIKIVSNENPKEML